MIIITTTTVLHQPQSLASSLWRYNLLLAWIMSINSKVSINTCDSIHSGVQYNANLMQSPQLHVYKISNCINPLTIDKLIKDTRQGEPKFEEQNCIPLGELFAF